MENFLSISFLIFALGTGSGLCSSIPWAQSHYHLKLLAKEEASIIEFLHTKSRDGNYQSFDIKCYMMDYEESTTFAQYKLLNTVIRNKEDLQVDKIVADHLILAYRLVRRIIGLVNHIVPKYSVTMKELNQHVQLMKRKIPGPTPTQADLTQMIDNVLRISVKYNLDIGLFASKGIILDHPVFGFGFSRDQMVEIGQRALEGNLFTEALQWYQAALNEKPKGKSPCAKYNRTMILDLIAEAQDIHDEFLTDGDFGYLPTFDDYSNPFRMYHRFSSKAVEKSPEVKVRNLYEQEYLEFRHPSNKSLEKDFEYLCNGKLTNKTIQAENHDCWFQRTKAYFLPFKVERHTEDLVQIYDIISPSLIKTLTNLALPNAVRKESKATYPDGIAYYKNQKLVEPGNPEVDSFVQNEVGIKSHSYEKAIFERMIYGKEPPLAQPNFYIESFGPGGYNTHENKFEPKLYEGKGSFVAFLHYFSDVVAGGQTVFMDSGIRVNPIKGSVVVFYEKQKFGECPVILGHKLTALKIMPLDV